MEVNPVVITPPRLGPYQFRGVIGEGAFSVVKLVLHTISKQYYACKIVPRDRITSTSLEERFEVEIRINQQLHHPGVVQIVDLLRDELNYYIFMEFCPNGDFFQFIVDRQRISEKEAAGFMRQVFEALKFVHSLGIAHRDLKPENLLLDSSDRLKISDFGLSKFVGSSGLVNTPCGSPCYASPECLSGKPYNGCKSDIWSCGVILFAALTGQLPWTKRNQQQLFNQIKSGDYVVPSFLSPECTEFIQGLMCVDSNKRLTIDQALNHPFLKQVDDDAVTVSPTLGIVSIKKVDNFFDNSEDLQLSAIVLNKQKSATWKTFKKTLRQIAEKSNNPSKLPMIRKSYSKKKNKCDKAEPQVKLSYSMKPKPQVNHSFSITAGAMQQQAKVAASLSYGKKSSLGPHVTRPSTKKATRL